MKYVEFTDKTEDTSCLTNSGKEVDQLKQHDLEDDLGEQEYVSALGTTVIDKETQTKYLNIELSAKIEAMLLRNKVNTAVHSDHIKIPSLSYENISRTSSSMKHFTGLETEQFEALYTFLDSVCPLDTISYTTTTNTKQSQTRKKGPEQKVSNREKLFICLVRLRRGFTLRTMATLFSSPTRSIERTTICKIFTTFIQLMYKVFRDMEDVMFPPRSVALRHLPRVFKTMRKIRCVVDCTEFSVQTSRDFARQGNTYSSYKHTNTFNYYSLRVRSPF